MMKVANGGPWEIRGDCLKGRKWPVFDKDRLLMSQPQKDHQCAIDAQLIGVLELT